MDDLIRRKDVERALTVLGALLSERQARTVAKCICIIKDIHAVDAEPVRHGTWEMCRKTLETDFATLTGTYPTCILCGHAEFGVDKSTPYCPNCGAKMDVGKNEQ